MPITQKISIKDVKLQNNKQYGLRNTSSSSKRITQHLQKPPAENELIEIIGTMPSISRKCSPIGRNIDFSKTHCLSDRKTGSNLKSCSPSSSTNEYCGQHDTSYYQHQPPVDYNQRK